METPTVPMIILDEIAEDKREVCQSLLSISRAIEGHINTFSHTVDLVAHIRQYAEAVEIPLRHTARDHEGKGSFGYEMTQRSKHGSWLASALRDGSATLGHIDYLIQCLTPKAMPGLEGFIETKKIQDAIDLFEKSFPNARFTRNSIAHKSEDQADPKKAKRNALKEGEYDYGMKVGEGSSAYVEVYSGDTISISRRGYEGGDASLVSVSIGKESLSKLNQAFGLIISSISPLVEKNIEAAYKTWLSDRGIVLPPDQMKKPKVW